MSVGLGVGARDWTSDRGDSYAPWSDIDFEKATVRWRAENDKIGFEHVTPLTPEAVAELRAARKNAPAIGDTWMFPAPKDPEVPVSRHLVRDWWQRLE